MVARQGGEKMKTNILLGGLLSILNFALASAVAQSTGDIVAFHTVGEPQVIHLDDHTKLTLLGTTFGSHHMAPGYENLRMANWIYTAPNTTFVWIEEEPKLSKQPVELLVSDRASTGCVSMETSSWPNGGEIQGFKLLAFPRWDKETILRVEPFRGAPSKEQFVLTNPVPGTFAHWTPEPLPATKSAGDLEVTLTKLVAGAPMPYREGSTRAPTNDPANQCVHLDFSFRVNGQSTTNWVPWPVQTTDASGNWSRGLIYAYPTNGVYRIWGRMQNGSNIPPPEHYGMDGYFYQPGLWPGRPWKVRLEFIQKSGFRDDEMVTFTSIPVKMGSQQDADDEWTAWDVVKPKLPPMIPDSTDLTPDTPQRDDEETNFPFTIIRGTVSGVHLKLLPPLLVVNRWQSSQKDISVIIGADANFNPKGMNLTVVSATDDQGRDVWTPETPAWAGHYSIEFGNVRDDIKSLNLTLALHKSRFVEFTVKPTK
jgi:hypothetical protein